jgi:UDP-3-O-acyl-N-acetylglucosamine deacetylase
VRVARRTDVAGDGIGLRFIFPGFNEPLTARDFATLTRRAHRATILTHPVSGAVIRTPEHLLAAALFFADEPLNIICDADEIPGLDGSAKPWFDLLTTPILPSPSGRGGGGEGSPKASTPSPRTSNEIREGGEDFPPNKPACRQYDTDLKWFYSGREGTLHAEPASRFSVRYSLERGEVNETFELADASDAPTEVLPARTFIFWSDWQALRNAHNAALLGGVDAESGLLLAESAEEFARALTNFPENAGNTFPLLHPRKTRFPDEAARHKVLDLLGDLALHGLALPKLHLTIKNGGHALNHLLLDALHASAHTRSDTKREGTDL